MRTYEELFIAKPDATEEDLDAFLEQMKTQITQAGGTVSKVDKWGKRRLAYKVGKYSEGSYVLIEFAGEATAVREFERRLRVADIVLKFLTVRTDETMKRIDKRRKQREKRAGRKAAAAPAMPQTPIAQQMMPEVPAEPVA